MPRHPRRNPGFLTGIHPGLVLWIVMSLWIHRPCFSQALVEPVFATWVYPDSDVDSVAVWVAPQPEDSLMFVTEKQRDRLEVWSPLTGRPHAPLHFIGGEQDSDEPGQFDRPNAVWVVYHVPFQDGFVDILLVSEQLNGRVQIFRLPELTHLGQFAAGDLSVQRYYGRGLGPFHDGEDHLVVVTDRKTEGKIKTYRLIEDGDLLGAELVGSFGDESGDDALNIVESVLPDTVLNRLHVCGDEQGDFIRVFDLDGEYTGITYGEPEFEFDQEGIVLYETGWGEGYILVSDQYRNGEPNEFEVYDRSSLEHLGHFESPAEAALSTTNTDGIYLGQQPIPGFPNGAFYAIHDDMNLHVYDWTDIAEAMDLEIVALDRPFRLGGGLPPRAPRPCLWFEDGSWWSFFATPSGLEVWRLEDGTFDSREVLDPAVTGQEVAVARTPTGIIALAIEEEATAYRLNYVPSQRRHEEAARATLDLGGSDQVALAVDGTDRAWVAWSEQGRLFVKGTPFEDFPAWEAGGQNLEASHLHPAFVQLPAQMVLLAADEISAFAYFHSDGLPSGAWAGPRRFGGEGVEGLTAVAVGEQVVVVLAEAEGGSVWTLDATGGEAMVEVLGHAVPEAALSADPATGALYLIYTAMGSTKRNVVLRSSGGPGETFGPATSLGENEEPPVDGTNSWGRTGYGGPCPGRGSGYHRYIFTLHALDVETLSLPASGDLDDLENAMEGHLLASTAVTGRYRRD